MLILERASPFRDGMRQEAFRIGWMLQHANFFTAVRSPINRSFAFYVAFPTRSIQCSAFNEFSPKRDSQFFLKCHGTILRTRNSLIEVLSLIFRQERKFMTAVTRLL